MAFAADRPENIVNLPVNPVGLGARAADRLTFGLASRFLQSRDEPYPDRGSPSDPVSTYVGLANLMTGGMAGRRLGINKKQLEIGFLVKHFLQHHHVVTSSLVTWRQIPDWLARDELPHWVESGISS